MPRSSSTGSISRATSTTIRGTTATSTRTTTRKRSDAAGAAALLGLAAWTLFAFAGVLRWTTVPLSAGALLLAIYKRPAILPSPYKLIDAALIAWLLLAALMLAPVPARARLAIAPASATIDRALYLDMPAAPAGAPARPLSIDRAATAWALALGGALVLLLWSARTIMAAGGLRATARGIAWLGLALSAVALVQHGTDPKRLYWSITPVGRSPQPFGPFVNRNDLATWLIMAMPLVAGYAIARVESRRRPDTDGLDPETTVDATALWLAASVLFMIATLLVAISRSGLIGAGVGVAGLMWLRPRRLPPAGNGRRAADVAHALAVT